MWTDITTWDFESKGVAEEVQRTVDRVPADLVRLKEAQDALAGPRAPHDPEFRHHWTEQCRLAKFYVDRFASLLELDRRHKLPAEVSAMVCQAYEKIPMARFAKECKKKVDSTKAQVKSMQMALVAAQDSSTRETKG